MEAFFLFFLPSNLLKKGDVGTAIGICIFLFLVFIFWMIVR